jgi:hypothetical protein
MIGQHPLLYGLPEFTMLRFDYVEEFINVVNDYRIGAHQNNISDLQLNVVGDLRAIAEVVYKDQSNTSIELAYTFLKKHAHYRTTAFFSMLQEAIAPKRVVFKAPIYSKKIEFMQNFPTNAYFIHLVRHPKDQVQSCLKYGKLIYAQALKIKNSNDFREQQIHDIKKKILLYGLNGYEAWLHAQDNIDSFLSTVSSNHKYRIRSESVVSTPRDALVNICQFLKINHDDLSIDRMLNPQTSVFATIGPDRAPYGNDSIFLNHPTIDFDHRVFSRDLEGLPLEVKRKAESYGY